MSKEMRMYIDKFTKPLLVEDVDKALKNKILLSYKDIHHGSKLPNEIKKLIKFNQIPNDVYDKINDYYNFEKTLPGDTYIEPFKQKLKNVGKGIDYGFLATLAFIELIGVDRLNDRYGTLKLYEDMLDEIRNLPDIKTSENKFEDYNTFRKTISEKSSPTRNLNLVIYSRFLDDHRHYERLIAKSY